MPTVKVTLDKEQYDPGQVMTATVTEDSAKRTLVVTSSDGTKFTKKSDNGSTAVFTAMAGKAGLGKRTVTVTMTDTKTGKLFTSEDVFYVGSQTTCLFGSSIAGDDGGLNLLLPGRRVYDDAAPPSRFADNKNFVTATKRTSPGGVIWMSFKGAVVKSQYQSFINSANDALEALGMTGLLTYEHEPEIKGAIDKATFHKGYDIIDPLCEGTVIEPIVNSTGYLGDAAPGKGHPTAFFPDEWETYFRANHKRWSCDHYNQGHGKDNEKFNDWERVFGNVSAYGLAKNKHILIGETGAGSITDRDRWYSEVVVDGCTASANMDMVFAFDARDTAMTRGTATAMFL